MTVQDLGSVGELVAAIATVAMLFYLALQIRQNTRSSRTAGFHAVMASSVWENRAIALDRSLAELFLRGLDSYDELDLVDKSRFSALMYNFIWHFEMTLSLYRQGISTDTRLEAQLGGVLERLSHPGAATWWKDAAIDQEVRVFIDARRQAAR